MSDSANLVATCMATSGYNTQSNQQHAAVNYHMYMCNCACACREVAMPLNDALLLHTGTEVHVGYPTANLSHPGLPDLSPGDDAEVHVDTAYNFTCFKQRKNPVYLRHTTYSDLRFLLNMSPWVRTCCWLNHRFIPWSSISTIQGDHNFHGYICMHASFKVVRPDNN